MSQISQKLILSRTFIFYLLSLSTYNLARPTDIYETTRRGNKRFFAFVINLLYDTPECGADLFAFVKSTRRFLESFSSPNSGAVGKQDAKQKPATKKANASD